MVRRLAVVALLAPLAACPRGGRGPEPGATPAGSPAAPQGDAANPVTIDGEFDAIVRAGWGDLAPAPRVDDGTFLRRATLDLTGRIPTAHQVAMFENDASPNKRRRVVNTMLSSEAYAEHWAEVYTNLLYIGAARVRPFVRADTRQWLEDQFASGVGYDAMARDMLAGAGEFDGPGPYGFLVTHGMKNDVEAVTGHTARMFLGVRLECAQCHDHPTDDRYKQEDFYAMAAYYARTRARLKKAGRQRIPVIVDKKRGEMRLPTATDAAGDRTGGKVAPRFLGRKLKIKPGQSRRAALAEGIIDSDLFAKAVVARTWQRVTGRGLVQSYDDLGGERDASHPASLQHLADRFVASGYDHADLLRTIVLSTAYQRASFAPERSATQERAAERVFAQAAVRPMDADQLFRSLMIATGVENSAGRRFRTKVAKKKQRALREYKFIFPDDENREADAFSGNVPQALLLLNGVMTTRGTSNVEGTTLSDILAAGRDPDERIGALYLAVYGRHPTRGQKAAMRELLAEQKHAARAYEDLMHAMLLSSEFLTIH